MANIIDFIRETLKEDFFDLEFSYIEVENNDEEDLGLATYAILSQLGLTGGQGQDWLNYLSKKPNIVHGHNKNTIFRRRKHKICYM